jgi:hypothetical protein
MIAEIFRVELTGGPSCGRVLDFGAQPPDILLIEIGDLGTPGRIVLHAYARTEDKSPTGRVVYAHRRVVGHKGGLEC